MRARAVQRIFAALRVDLAVITNAASIAGTTVVTSLLGFAYWWVAIRLFSADVVGFSSAAISAMTLLGSIGMLGLGTVLMGELPKSAKLATPMILSGMLIAAVASVFLGSAFAIAAPLLSSELQPLSESILHGVVFSLGVGLTSASFVLDQALIGLLSGSVQFWRNSVFAASKLVFVLVVSYPFVRGDSMVIYLTWLAGNLVSLVVPGWYLFKSRGSLGGCGLEWAYCRGLTRHALGHHALNLALQAPGLLLPVLVTALLSARVNASFYAAWMIASFAFAVPFALTTVLFPIASSDPKALARGLRLTLPLSFLSGIASTAIIVVAADFLLSVFGGNYAQQASSCLRVLGFSVFPAIVRYHYVVVARIWGMLLQTTRVMFVGGFVELALSVLGGVRWGLTGLTIGWTAAILLESIVMIPLLLRALFPNEQTA